MSSLSVAAFFFFLGNFLFPLDPVQATKFTHLGCYKDFWKSRALPNFLGRFPKHLAAKKCANLAKKAGYTTFAVQDGGYCFSGISADHTYNVYGRANNCKGGVGGSWANDVYQFPLYILLKTLRDNYKRLQVKANLHDRKLESLHRGYQSLSNKQRSLQSRLTALNRRVSRSGHVSCYNKATSWQPSSNAPIMFLDRHHVTCPRSYVLASFYLTRSADKNSAPVRYIYRCCRFFL